jgi:hypothetical protein
MVPGRVLSGPKFWRSSIPAIRVASGAKPHRRKVKGNAWAKQVTLATTPKDFLLHGSMPIPQASRRRF